MRAWLTHIVLILLFVCASSADAIVIRHDKPDTAYQTLAKPFEASLAYMDRCVATVLSEYWLITAAHCVSAKNQYPVSMTHGNRQYPVERIVLHPEAHKLDDIDVALLQLRWPLVNARPVPVYAESNELNQPVIFVGKGKTGTGVKGEQFFDRTLRAATNTVQQVEPNWLTFEFHQGFAATELEGVSGTEDSGGPALSEVNGVYQILGVGCCQEPTRNSQGQEVQGMYGAKEYYARVSQIKSWIDNTVAQQPSVPASSIASTIKRENTQKASALIQQTDLTALPAAELEEILLASAYYAPPVIKTLIAQSPDLAKVRIKTLPLTVYAYMQGNKALLSMLIKHNVALEHTGFRGQQLPALLAWQYFQDDYAEKVAALIQTGLDINHPDERGDTALHMAVYSGKPERVKSLVALGADINHQNNRGHTPLMDAVRRDNRAMVSELMALGADTQLTNSDGMTAQALAEKQGAVSLIQILATE